MRSRVSLGHFVLLLSALTVLASAYALWCGFRFYEREFPDVSVLKNHYPVVKYRGPHLRPEVELVRARPSGWVSVSAVSKVAVGAIIVSEDWAFYQHHGYDPAQIKDAIKEDWEQGRYKRGASTITQQVVRNVFLSKDKNLWRKLKELVLAIRLEDCVSKRKILETYLNIAEWGEGIYGIGEAARFYFQKTPAQLTAPEGAFLAMLLPSPRRYSQSFRQKQLTRYARKTIDAILKKMAQAHFITDQERDLELGARLSFETVVPEPGAVQDAGEENAPLDEDDDDVENRSADSAAPIPSPSPFPSPSPSPSQAIPFET